MVSEAMTYKTLKEYPDNKNRPVNYEHLIG